MTPFICKVDIEGAESDLYAQNTAWFKHFPLHAIELHDWMLPFKKSSASFYRLLANHNYDVLNHGENTFCFSSALETYLVK
jgi:hypothetical protein